MTQALAPLAYGRQTIDEDDIAAVTSVLRSPWLTCGPMVERFEAAFAAAVDAPYAVACSSGTAALHLACLGQRFAPGDAAIVPAITFVATANAVRYCGAEVVFADVDPRTGLIRRDDVAEAIGRARLAGLRPKLVLPVHLSGQVCAMPEIAQLAQDLGLGVIEDGCHAVGSEYCWADGERASVGACRHADAVCFSLHPVKTVTMGEGGVVTTASPELAQSLKRYRNHGAVRAPGPFVNGDLAVDEEGLENPWYMEFQDIGFNYRASDIHCALGLSQLGKLDRFVNARRGLVGYYQERLALLAPLVTPVGRAPSCRPAWHLAVARINFAAAPLSRGALMRRLAASGIGTQVHYVPLHLQPYYRHRYGAISLPGAEAYYARCLSLPLFPTMSTADVDRVVDALAACLGQDTPA